MNRNYFQPVLANMVREQTRQELQRRDEGRRPDDATFNRDQLSCIKRFVEIELPFGPEAVTKMLRSETTAWMDTQIDKYQKAVDEYLPEPSNSRMKEIRKEKVRKPVLRELKHLLAARALRGVEHEQGLVHDDGQKPIVPDADLGIQYWEYSPFNTDKLKAMREARIRNEKREVSAARKMLRDKLESAQEGKAYYGNWGFKNEEEEAVAQVFLREANNEPVTANAVVIASLGLVEDGPSVQQNIDVIWIEDHTFYPEMEDDTEDDEPQELPRRRRQTKKSLIVVLPVGFACLSSITQNVVGQSTKTNAPPLGTASKKSMVIVLPVDFARLSSMIENGTGQSTKTNAPPPRAAPKKSLVVVLRVDSRRLASITQNVAKQQLQKRKRQPTTDEPPSSITSRSSKLTGIVEASTTLATSENDAKGKDVRDTSREFTELDDAS